MTTDCLQRDCQCLFNVKHLFQDGKKRLMMSEMRNCSNCPPRTVREGSDGGKELKVASARKYSPKSRLLQLIVAPQAATSVLCERSARQAPVFDLL